DAEGRPLDAAAEREGLVWWRHPRRARRRRRDREHDLVVHDLRERRGLHSGVAGGGERIVEIRPDRPRGPGLRERVAAPTGLDEELLARALAPLARVPPGAAARAPERGEHRARRANEGSARQSGE